MEGSPASDLLVKYWLVPSSFTSFVLPLCMETMAPVGSDILLPPSSGLRDPESGQTNMLPLQVTGLVKGAPSVMNQCELDGWSAMKRLLVIIGWTGVICAS